MSAHGLPVVQTLADRLVLASTMLVHPEASDWRLAAVGAGGERIGARDLYRFRDGSMVCFTADGLPVAYVGG
jgi:hypothetical protein